MIIKLHREREVKKMFLIYQRNMSIFKMNWPQAFTAGLQTQGHLTSNAFLSIIQPKATGLEGDFAMISKYSNTCLRI